MFISNPKSDCRSCAPKTNSGGGVRSMMSARVAFKDKTAVIDTLERAGVLATTDEALMKDISHRRHDALAELYGRHGKRLRATIDGVGHEQAEGDDVLQEILLQIWKEADHYSPKAGRPLGWMVTIARRRAIVTIQPRGLPAFGE